MSKYIAFGTGTFRNADTIALPDNSLYFRCGRHQSFCCVMKTFYLLPVFILLPTSLLSQQTTDYQSRGVKSYLVNYGAMQSNRYLAQFAARRFALIDEGSPTDIALVHKTNQTLPILVYRDVVALHPVFQEFAEVNTDEHAFLHSTDPSSLTIMKRGDTASLYWMNDRRNLQTAGYRVYWSIDSLGPYTRMVDSLITQTKLAVRLPKSAARLNVAAVLKNGSELQYGLPCTHTSQDRDDPMIAVRAINVIRTANTVQFHIDAASVADVTPDSIVMVCDENRNNILDTLRERSPMIFSGARWSVDKTITLQDQSYGGFEFVIYAYKNRKRFRFPSEGAYTTTVNNRLMNDYYGFFVMDVGSSTWRKAYIDQVKKSFSALGYNGLFEDDTWYRVESWGVDAFPPVNYNEYRWRKDLYTFLDSIKIQIAPKPAYFNGLYANTSDSLLLHTDGGMTEGFAYTHWSQYVTGDYWKVLCNLGLKAQHTYRRAWLALGGAPYNEPKARMYVLGSYHLVADSLSMYANATDYQEFAHYPEFDIALGKPITSAVNSVDELQKIFTAGNVTYYVREFERGTVVVNPNAAKEIVYDQSRGRKCLVVVGGLTIDSGRVETRLLSDTIAPKQARIYLNSSSSNNILASPVIGEISITPNPIPADGTTQARLRVFARDDSSPTFRSDSTKPLRVIADLGELGGARELQLINDGTSTPGIASWYEGTFIIPIGAPPTGADIPITVFSTTGLVTIGHAHIEIVGADTSNLILNFSFEIDNNDDGIPDLWRQYVKGFDYDTSGAIAKSGRRSVHVKNDSLSESRGVYYILKLDQTIPTDLELSGWSKAVNVSGAKNNDYSLYIDIHYQDGTPLYGQTAQFSTGSHDWEYASRIIRPAKPIKDLALYALFRNHTGEVWFDHIALRNYSPPTSAKDFPTPSKITLLPHYPNPVSQSVVIPLVLDTKRHVTLTLYNSSGVQIQKWIDADIDAGEHTFLFDARQLHAGVYFYRVQIDDKSFTRAMIVRR